jgi:hypothetical protein
MFVCFILGNTPASEFYTPTDPSYLSAYEDGTKGSETSAHKIQTPENYPEAQKEFLDQLGT